MKIIFYKYQGTGNDFVIIDNRQQIFSKKSQTFFRKICDRRFGIGADGLILLQNHLKFDFEMIYFNADGKEGSMCGNGGRCIVAFAKFLKIIDKKTSFSAIDGVHDAVVLKNNLISLKMNNVQHIKVSKDHILLNTGSPHYVKAIKNIIGLDAVEVGKKIRYSSKFKKEGINVNFIQKRGKDLFIRTYERGVENETFSCGTGAIAAAIAANQMNLTTTNQVKINALGGILQVSFEKNKQNQYKNIWLTGPVQQTFTGNIEIKL